MTEDLDLDLDWDWARELFDRTRGAGEPGFTADPMALARAGDRRRRLRALGAGGGLAGVVAVTVAVAVGLGAGTTDAGSQPGPGGAWGNRPLSDVFHYVSEAGANPSGEGYVPVPAASDLATVVGRLDPSLTHLTPFTGAPQPHIVAAGETHAKQAFSISMGSVWADAAAPRRSGELSFGFASTTGWALMPRVNGLGDGQLGAPCSLPIDGLHHSPTSVPQTPVQWSSCTVTRQSDGSTIGTATGRLGTGTAIVAVREFADGEVFSVVAQDFAWQGTWPGKAPDPANVLQPTPWSQSSLAAALADPSVRSGWNPPPKPNADGTLLAPSDLGKGWSYDTSIAVMGTSGKYGIANGCGAQQLVPLTGPGPDAYYAGPLVNGVLGTAHESEYRFRSGVAAPTMAKDRSGSQGGCVEGSIDRSTDTVLVLPAGIGDGAFVASVPSLQMLSVEVRVGDTILKTDLIDHDTEHYQSGRSLLDLSAPANQQWLADIARSMVARHTGTTRH